MPGSFDFVVEESWPAGFEGRPVVGVKEFQVLSRSGRDGQVDEESASRVAARSAVGESGAWPLSVGSSEGSKVLNDTGKALTQEHDHIKVCSFNRRRLKMSPQKVPSRMLGIENTSIFPAGT